MSIVVPSLMIVTIDHQRHHGHHACYLRVLFLSALGRFDPRIYPQSNHPNVSSICPFYDQHYECQYGHTLGQTQICMVSKLKTTLGRSGNLSEHWGACTNTTYAPKCWAVKKNDTQEIDTTDIRLQMQDQEGPHQ